MSGTSSRKSFKRTNRDLRGVLTERAFGAGMFYTDNPLIDGRSRLLVNLIQKDMGERTRPRGGIHPVTESINLDEFMDNPYVHHTGVTIVTNAITGLTALRRYALIVNYPQSEAGKEYISLAGSKLILEIPHDRNALLEHEDLTDETYVGNHLEVSTNMNSPYKIKHNPHNMLIKSAGMLVDEPTPDGIFADVGGNTYLMTDQGLGRLNVTLNGLTYSHGVTLVEPEQPSASKGMTSGYNMLLSEPYLFPNATGSRGDITSVLPYDPVETTRLRMNARFGDTILFRAGYIYENGVSYKMKWEVQGINRTDNLKVIQSQQASPLYSNGADITIKYTPTERQFTIIATLYAASDLDEPLRVMTVPVFNLTNNDTVAARPATNFDFKTMKGMTVWKEQVVVWGVKDSETGIFISAVNDPTYFPYPQNYVVVDDRVLSCADYMGELVVVTESGMYLVTMSDVGYTTRKVQSNLEVQIQDAPAIFSMRNLIHFKSSDHYFMVVPDMRNDQGNLQIAPITANMTYLFDNFRTEVYRIINDLYNIHHLMNVPTHALEFKLMDYKCVRDSMRIRNVYRMMLASPDLTVYLDVHLVYDTVFRSWTVEIMQVPKAGLFLFQSLATGYAEYLSITKQGPVHVLEWLHVQEHDVQDTFLLDGEQARLFNNQQMLDTGKRDLAGAMKKRMRHVIVEFNNLQNEEIPLHHLFYLDDQERSDLYQYEVVHITDPADANYGSIYVERTYSDPETIESEVFVERTYTEPDLLPGTSKLNSWMLSTSQFPDVTLIKVHIDVSGKGYYPRLKLIMKEPKLYEINNISWVWREMNAR
jgi:hypothetical protein